MKILARLGVGLVILGIVISMVVTAPYLSSAASFRIGPLRASILIAALMAITLGLDIAFHIRDTEDATLFFYRYRLEYLLSLIGQSMFIILLLIDRRFGLPLPVWLPLLFLTAFSELFGVLLLLSKKVKLIRMAWTGDILMHFDSLQENWSTRIVSFTSRYRNWMPATAILVVLIQFLLFRTSFSNNFAPFFPAAFDQIETFKAVYQAVFSIRDHGPIEALHGQLLIKADPRGWLVPFIGLISAILFGPTRIAVASANFLFFIIGQIALWIVLYRWKGLPAALFGEGLILLSKAYYAYPLGGLMDLRFDFAGMVTLGISFLSLVLFIEKPTYKKLLICLLIFQIAVSSRSITIVYLLGAQGLLLLYFIYRHLAKQDSSGCLRFVFILLVGTLLEVFLFVAMQWQPINDYYVAALRAGEGPIRDAESGLASFWERPSFYWNSIGYHYQYYIPFVIVVCAVLVVKAFTAKSKKGWVGSGTFFDVRTKFTYLIFLVISISFFIAVNLYGPSPVVASVLTIPFVFTLTVGLVNAFSWLRPALLSILAGMVFIIGFGNYTTAMVAPGAMPYGSRADAQTINVIYADISNYVYSDSRIDWMFLEQALDSEAFIIYWNETYHEQPPASLRQSSWRISAITADEIIKEFKLSDIVIAPIQINSVVGFDYPYNVSIKETQYDWQPFLEREFTLIKSYSITRGEIGLYIRSERISKIHNENGLEQHGGLPFFWLGQGATQVHISTTHAGFITLTADLTPGPSLPETHIRHVRISSSKESFDLTLPDTQQRLSLTLAMDEGENIITLLPLDQPTLHVLPNGDRRPLLLGISDLKISR